MRHIALLAVAIAALLSASTVWAQGLLLPEGTAIHLETRQDVSSKSARVGDRIELAVADPVVVDGVTVIPAGAPAVGEVSRVKGNGFLGRSGRLDIRVTNVKAGEVDVPLRGQRNAKGRSGTIGMIGAGVVFLPLAILVHGKDAKLKAGTRFDVFVDRNVTLSASAPNLESAPADVQPPPAPIRSVNPDY